MTNKPKHVMVIVNGPPRSGKDTVCQYMGEALDAMHVKHSAVSSIDGVRQMLRDWGFPVDLKGPKERKLLSDVGDAVETYNNFRTAGVLQHADAFFGTYWTRDAVVFVHIREPQLIMKLVKLSTVKVVTIGVKSKWAIKELSNHADANALDYVYDRMIINDGTLQDLKDECSEVAAQIIGRR